MELKTAGTHLFMLDPDDVVPVVRKFKCPTGIAGITTGTRGRANTTCLDDTDTMQYAATLMDPGAASVPFILDSEDASHQEAFELKKGSRKLLWMACLSDGIASPTVAAGALVPASDRTCIAFEAYISELDIDIATNEVVRGTMTLQRSGDYTVTWKDPV